MARRTPRSWQAAVGCLVAVLAAACQEPGPTTPSPPQAIVAVAVGGWSSPLSVGQSVQLSATATLADGTSRSVTTEAAWATSNGSVAIVSPAGLVVAQSAGRADITARYGGRNGVLPLEVFGAAPPAPVPGLVCGVERWAVKTLSDPDAARVDLGLVEQTTVRALNERARRCSGLPATRAFDEEFQVYELIGRVIYVRLEDDRDYHVAVADPADPAATIVTEVADIACQGAISSPHRGALESARNALVTLLAGRAPSSLVGATIRVRGVGFYDFDHGQIGRSRNCMELHPILSIERTQ